ncbi:MAG: DUF3817 domain-containing protein [Thermoleophilia bacterium]|nr:DUF3817 domain-containing protein [Thermoleophilia bacterium]
MTPPPIGRAYVFSALVEAGTWLGLLVGMFLKYVTDTTEAGVQVFGALHGVAFLAYAAITVTAAVRLRWRPWVTVVALLASIPPFTTIPAERWITRRGDLADRPVRGDLSGAEA